MAEDITGRPEQPWADDRGQLIGDALAAMSRDRSMPCGCRYINTSGPVGNCWWHVDSCPAHALHARPLAEVPSLQQEDARNA